MKLARIEFSGAVCIFAGKDNGAGEPRADLRDQSFDTSDGWELYEDSPGLVRVYRDGMPESVYVRASGYSYLLPAVVEAKGKKR